MLFNLCASRHHRATDIIPNLALRIEISAGTLGYLASQPAIYPQNYPHESVAVNGMKRLPKDVRENRRPYHMWTEG
ncbi:hypothetical protein PSAC2689_50394 [Paraburkholderia sacchari]